MPVQFHSTRLHSNLIATWSPSWVHGWEISTYGASARPAPGVLVLATRFEGDVDERRTSGLVSRRPVCTRAATRASRGFRFSARFALGAHPPTTRAFVGLSARGRPIVDRPLEPGRFPASTIGVGLEPGDGSWKLLTSDERGHAQAFPLVPRTKIGIGEVLATMRPADYVYDLRISTDADALGVAIDVVDFTSEQWILRDVFLREPVWGVGEHLPAIDAKLFVHAEATTVAGVEPAAIDVVSLTLERMRASEHATTARA